MWSVTTVVPMPRMLLSLRTERTISWLARRMAFRTRRAGAGSSASSPNGERNEAGRVGSLRGSLPEMCLSMDSTARREATSPAACPPIPSATTSSVPSPEMEKESSFDLRLRPTSLRPAVIIEWCRAPRAAAALARDTGSVLLLRRQLVELGERRLVVRLPGQNRAQLLDRLPVLTRLRQGEGQVQPRERILRIRFQCPAKRGDRFLPAQSPPGGQADVVVQVGEVRAELAGQAEALARLLVLPLGQGAQRPPIVKREALRPPQEGLAHPLLGLAAVAARQRLPRLRERLVDGPHRQIARLRELLQRLVLLPRRKQQEGELHARLEIARVQSDGAPMAFDRLEAEVEAGVQPPHTEMDVGVVGGQRQRLAVPLDRRLQVLPLLRLLGGGDVRLRQVIDRHAPVGLGRLGRLQHLGQELDRLFRLAAMVVVQARLQPIVAEQLVDRLEQPHQRDPSISGPSSPSSSEAACGR